MDAVGVVTVAAEVGGIADAGAGVNGVVGFAEAAAEEGGGASSSSSLISMTSASFLAGSRRVACGWSWRLSAIALCVSLAGGVRLHATHT